MFIQTIVFFILITGIRGTGWKAVVAVIEDMRYLEAKEMICLVEAVVSKRKKFPELGIRCN